MVRGTERKIEILFKGGTSHIYTYVKMEQRGRDLFLIKRDGTTTQIKKSEILSMEEK